MLAKEVPTLANGGVSEDFQTWTFKLRDDVKWHDGQPFTSADVAFTLGVVQSVDVTVAVGRAAYEGITVETPDATTVFFQLPNPNTTFLELWAYSGIVPKHVLEGVDVNTADFNIAPTVGTGPFKFVEWVSGSHITVEKNPDYYLGEPAIDRIIYQVVPSTDVLLSMMETGEIDMRFLVSTEQAPVVQDLAGWKLYSTQGS
jgi:peptide/nickel transport system substrate-binding protein